MQRENLEFRTVEEIRVAKLGSFLPERGPAYRAGDDRLIQDLQGLRVRTSHSPCCCLQASPCNQDWELPLTKLARKSRQVRPSWVYAVAIGVTVPRVPVRGFSHGMLVSFSPRLRTTLAAARA